MVAGAICHRACKRCDGMRVMLESYGAMYPTLKWVRSSGLEWLMDRLTFDSHSTVSDTLLTGRSRRTTFQTAPLYGLLRSLRTVYKGSSDGH